MIPLNKSGPAYALGKIGPEAREAIPRLRKVVTIDGDDYDRTVALTALRNIEGDTDFVISALIDLFKCDYPYGRSYAARTLGNIGPKANRAIPALQYILDHPPTGSASPPPPPPAAAKNPTLPFLPGNPTTGTVGLATVASAYPQIREEVLEALKKIRKSE
jgi:HEAT repeat protein